MLIGGSRTRERGGGSSNFTKGKDTDRDPSGLRGIVKNDR